MRIVIALGGNALLQRGQPLEASIQRKNIQAAAEVINRVALEHDVILTHGNGPQVGLLALQNNAYKDVTPYPLDTLGAQTCGMIGYLFQQELYNQQPGRQVVTLVTQTLVDPKDPAFNNPTKYIGPVYDKLQAEKLAEEKNWTVKADGEYYRRVVPSPLPQSICEIDSIKDLSAKGVMVIASGGGGVPVVKSDNGTLTGIEAVIDKDLAAALMAEQMDADALIIMTDVDAVCINFGKENQQSIAKISPKAVCELDLPAGSMGPKVKACAKFVDNGGQYAAIGSLYELENIVKGVSGTHISNGAGEVSYY